MVTAKSPETPPMSHKLFSGSILSKARVWAFLKRVHEAEAEACREAGCPRCGGDLHSARYPRKPHGLAPGLRDDVRRFGGAWECHSSSVVNRCLPFSITPLPGRRFTSRCAFT